MKVFVDANVLISVLNKELPNYQDDARFLSLAGHARFELYTSPMCLAIAFYFAEKKSGTILAKSKIDLLSRKISISEHHSKDVKSTIANAQIHDFEDGLEYYSAKHSKCQFIVTHDLSDFYFSEIEVIKPRDFLLKHYLKI